MPSTKPLTKENLEVLKEEFAGLEGAALIKKIHEHYGNQIAVLTSAGVDASITLHAVSKIDPSITVLFGDTKKHFKQTTQHMDLLKQRFGLTNVVSPSIDQELLDHFDPEGALNESDKDLCCGVRKVDPLERYVQSQQIRVLIGGRMSWQTASRESLQLLEWDDRKNVLMVNPFANLTRAEAASLKEDLPEHPLQKLGYSSVGCEPCTKPSEGREGRKFGGKGDVCPLNPSDRASRNAPEPENALESEIWQQDINNFRQEARDR